MRYFQQLPKIQYTDFKGSNLTFTNLLVRVNLIPALLKNPLLFYQYDIQESDTPEILADKYYGTVDDFWIVMLSNQLLDPQWDWPLSYANFQLYIADKYGSAANAMSNTYQYTMTTTTTDQLYGSINSITTVIDANYYASIIPSSYSSTLPSGDVVTVSTTKQAVSAYDYEMQLNESKRSIRLINKQYAPLVKTQLQQLLSQ